MRDTTEGSGDAPSFGTDLEIADVPCPFSFMARLILSALALDESLNFNFMFGKSVAGKVFDRLLQEISKCLRRHPLKNIGEVEL